MEQAKIQAFFQENGYLQPAAVNGSIEPLWTKIAQI
jgi:hypothetical protein